MIRHLLFDIDNTLYPASSAMNSGISLRMNRFVSEFLGISLDEAIQRRKKGLTQFGTTLEWLSECYGLTDKADFFARVHPESEINELTPDPALRPFLQSLDMPMSVLTNAPAIHAERVLDFFNVSDLFISAHNLESLCFKGKPCAEAYSKAVEASGFSIKDTVFFDDHLKYITGYEELGGLAIWIRNTTDNTRPALPSIYHIPDIFDKTEKGFLLKKSSISGA